MTEKEEYVDLSEVGRRKKAKHRKKVGKKQSVRNNRVTRPKIGREKRRATHSAPKSGAGKKTKPKNTEIEWLKNTQSGVMESDTTGERIRTEVDRLYDIVRTKGIVKIGDAAKKLDTDPDQIEEWGRLLEDYDLVKLHYPPLGRAVLILKTFKTDAKIPEKKLKKPPKKAVLIGVSVAISVVLIGLFRILLEGPVRIRINYSYLYLTIGAIIIIAVLVLFFIIMRRRAGNGEKKKKER